MNTENNTLRSEQLLPDLPEGIAFAARIGLSLMEQYSAIESRALEPTESLTSLLLGNTNALIKKEGEEGAEYLAALARGDAANFLEEVQQSKGWLPMVAAVSLGVPARDYFAALANLRGDA
jgi:phosphoribosyl-ATP pyrophosphohydrolase